MDGFRALVSTEGALRVRSRNRWAVTRLLPELEPMPRGLLLDGELIAWGDGGLPDFDRLCARLLHGEGDVAVTFMVFDLLRVDGHSLLETPYERRRRLLEELDVNGAAWFTPTCSKTAPRCGRSYATAPSKGSSRSDCRARTARGIAAAAG